MISNFLKKMSIKKIMDYDVLSIGTILYIILPVIIFLAFWVKSIIAVPIIVLLIYVLFFKQDFKLKEKRKINKKEKIVLIFTFIMIFVWLVISGVGGFMYQTSDYFKHNAVLHDLIENPNPVIYSLNNGSQSGLLVYYIGYYLPASLFGKLFGFNVANIFLFIWAYVGLIIGMMWIFRIFKKISIIPVILLILFGGLDIFGQVVMNGIDGLFALTHKEWWINSVINIQFSSITTLLFWVPQMFTPALILTPMLFYYRDKLMPRYMYLMMVASFLWSPFICVGLVSFFIYNFIVNIKKYGFKTVINVPMIISVLLTSSIVILYIMSNIGTGISENGLLWKVAKIPIEKYVPYIIFFCLIEFYLLFKIILKGNNRDFKLGYLFIAVTILMLLVMFKYGKYNDLVMRASIPALIIMYIYFCNTFMNSIKENKKILAVICIIYTFFMSYNSGIEILRNINRTKIGFFENYSDTLKSLQNFEEEDLFSQYISTNYEKSLFYKYILRK